MQTRAGHSREGMRDEFLLCKWAGRVTDQAWVISLPRDVGAENACTPWVHSLCVSTSWAKKMKPLKCNAAVSSTRTSGRSWFLCSLHAELWLPSAARSVHPMGEAPAEKHLCCTSEKPLRIAAASFSLCSHSILKIMSGERDKQMTFCSLGKTVFWDRFTLRLACVEGGFTAECVSPTKVMRTLSGTGHLGLWAGKW